MAPVSARTLPLALICPPLASRDWRSSASGCCAGVEVGTFERFAFERECKGQRAAAILETQHDIVERGGTDGDAPGGPGGLVGCSG